MTKKVKLPKAVCDALDLCINRYQINHSEIIYLMIRKAFYNVDTNLTFMHDEDAETIMRALVLGYEPELTAEEQLKERYENCGDFCTYEHFLGYRDGVKDALHLHGIKYDWIKGWGEDDAE